MGFRNEEYTLHQSWVHFTVPVGGNETFLLPVDTLRIRPVPYSRGSDGDTVVTNVNGTKFYRNDGFRHDATLSWNELPIAHHQTVQDLVNRLHNTGGEGTLALAAKDGTVSGEKAWHVVADFGPDALTVTFDKRVRARPATLSFVGKEPKNQPFNWLTD